MREFGRAAADRPGWCGVDGCENAPRWAVAALHATNTIDERGRLGTALDVLIGYPCDSHRDQLIDDGGAQYAPMCAPIDQAGDLLADVEHFIRTVSHGYP